MVVNLAIGFVTPADRSQSVCGFFTYGYSNHADCKESNAVDPVFPCGAGADYFYSSDQSYFAGRCVR